jgi:hypothetical protein
MHPALFRERAAGLPPTDWVGAFLTDSCAGPNEEFLQQFLSNLPELAKEFLQRRPPAPEMRPCIHCQLLSRLETNRLFGASCSDAWVATVSFPNCRRFQQTRWTRAWCLLSRTWRCHQRTGRRQSLHSVELARLIISVIQRDFLLGACFFATDERHNCPR